jgi:hypothetical protein
MSIVHIMLGQLHIWLSWSRGRQQLVAEARALSEAISQLNEEALETALLKACPWWIWIPWSRAEDQKNGGHGGLL